MQQKVALMVVLIKNPQIMILDEPTLGLDLVSTIKMIDILKKIIGDGKTLIIVSHDLEVIRQLCERVIFLKDGEVNFDEPIGTMLRNNTFIIKLKYDKSVVDRLELKKLSYEVDDGIIMYETQNLLDTLAIFPIDYVISIEKENDTLEKYIRERIGK